MSERLYTVVVSLALFLYAAMVLESAFFPVVGK